MNKTVLVPTDFSIESVAFLRQVLQNMPEGEKVDVVMLHGMHISDSITDLLFFSRSRTMSSLTNQQFEDACDIIANKFSSKINDLRKELVLGFDQDFVDKFLENHNIVEAYVPSEFNPHFHHKLSYDVVPFIKSSPIKVNVLEWQLPKSVTDKGNLSAIFNSELAISS